MSQSDTGHCDPITPAELQQLRAERGLPPYATPERRKGRIYGIVNWDAYDRREAARAVNERERHRRKAAERRRQREALREVGHG